MSHERPVTVLRRLCGYMAIGLAAVIGGVPASLAQDSRVVDHGKLAGTGIGAEEGQRQPSLGSNSGVSIAVPIGRVSVGPEVVDGEPIYVRRMMVKEGMTVVEVSTTPFMPVLLASEGPRGVGASIVRPDQPASW